MEQLSPKYRHPPVNVPVLEWWKAEYDHVFVVFNPFFRVPGFHPLTAKYGPIHQNFSLQQLLEHIHSFDCVNQEFGAPDDFEDIVKTKGQSVSWQVVMAELGATDLMCFGRTLWLTVLEVPRDDRDETLRSDLLRFQSEKGLYFPEEDMPGAILEPDIFNYLTALEHSEFTLWNEWGDKSINTATKDLGKSEPAIVMEGEKHVAISAPGLLMSWSFDDIVGLLAVTDTSRNKADPSQFFEGFWLKPDDFSDVFNPREMFDRTATPFAS